MIRLPIVLLVLVASAPALVAEEDPSPPPASVPDLMRDLMDPDERVRTSAAEGLAALGTGAAPAVDALWLAVRSDVESVSEAALRALLASGEAAAKHVGIWLQSPANRQAFERRLVAGVPLLLALTRHESWYVRESALKALGRLDLEGERIPDVLTFLEDPSAAVRLAALRVVCESGAAGENIFQAILARWKEPHPQLRRGALVAVGAITEPADRRRELLLEASRDADPDLRHLALAFLRERGQGDAVVAALRRGLEEKSSRTLAALALAERGVTDDDVLAALGAGLATASTYRWLMGYPFEWNPERRNLRGRGARSSRWRWHPGPVSIDDVASALVAVGRRSAGVLFDELRSREPRRRANAIWLLGRIGGPEVLIETAYVDESREVRLLAAITNARIGRENKYTPGVLVRSLHWRHAEGIHVDDARTEKGPPYGLHWEKEIMAAFKSLGEVAARPLAGVIEEDAGKGHASDPWMYRAIVALGPEALGVVPALARSWSCVPEGEGTRKLQAEALRAIGPDARSVLEGLLEAGEEGLRKAAKEMLGVLAGSDE